MAVEPVRFIRSLRCAVLSAALIALTPSPSVAQTPVPTPPAGGATPSAQVDSTPKADLFAGIAVWGEEGSTWPGVQFTAAIRPWRHVGFVGDVAFFEPRTTVMGGVRVYVPIQRVTVFAQMLVGTAPLDDFALQPGAGVDVHLTRRAAIRVAGDMKVSGDDGSTYLGARFSTGVVLLLGRR